jgi:hypothetical protein
VSSTATYLPDLADIRRADRVQTAGLVRLLIRVSNQCDALVGAVIAKVETEGVKATYGYSSAAAWLDDLTGIGLRDAGRIVRRARLVNGSHGLDGTEISATAPLAGSAAREGAISPAHVEVIARAMARIPATVSEEDRAGAEKILVDLARDTNPGEVRRAGERLVDTFDPDGPEPADPPGRPVRELSFREHRDGTASIKGVLDSLAYARLRAALDPLAALNSFAAQDPLAAQGMAAQGLAAEGGRDTRGLAERQADALVELVRLAMTVDEMPTHGGDRAHVTITMDYEALKSGIGIATLEGGGKISAAEARKLACDCTVIPVVLGTESEPMDLGRAKRLITTGLRRRLTMRDRGCTFPGCRRTAKHCDGHHVIYWILGGPTDLGNLTLLCERHHRLIHTSDWEIRMGTDGKPDFIPPAYLDPLRRPRRNTFHL